MGAKAPRIQGCRVSACADFPRRTFPGGYFYLKFKIFQNLVLDKAFVLDKDPTLPGAYGKGRVVPMPRPPEAPNDVISSSAD